MERALRDFSLGTEERLKVACVVARNGSSDIPEDRIPFLTRWACEEICRAYSKKNRSPPTASVVSQLWLFLATMMESRRQLTGKKEDSAMVPQREAQLGSLFSVHLLQAMGEVLGSSAAIEECIQSVLNCLLYILHHQPTLPPILYKFEVVVSLLLALLTSATSREEVSSAEERGDCTLLMEKVLCIMLDHFSYLQGTQGNQKKVFKAVCCQLLGPVVKLRQSTPVMNDCSGTLRPKLDTLLSSLFSRDHLLEFSSALSDSAAGDSTATGRGQGVEMSYTKLLFSALRDLLHSDAASDHEREAVVGAVPVLFQGFLHQNRELKKLSKAIEFNFFLKLLWVIGFSLPATAVEAKSSGRGEKLKEPQRKKAKIDSTKSEESSDEENSEEDSDEVCGGEEVMEGEDGMVEEKEEEKMESELDWELLYIRVETNSQESEMCGDTDMKEPQLHVLKTCLHLLRSYNVYQIMEDHSHGSKQFNSLSFLCTALVKNLNQNNVAVVGECLSEALQLNHKLVEPLLTGLLLLATSTSSSVRWKFDSFVQQCITIYSKLHQLTVLVSSLLSALQRLAVSQNLPTTFSPAFSKPSEEWFCRHVQEMSAGQSVALLEQVTHSLQSFFLAKLSPTVNDSSSGSVEEDSRPRKKQTRQSKKEIFEEVGGEAVPSCFVSALLQGVDVLSLVLLNTPVSVWTSGGLHRERAREALLAVQRDVHQPLLTAAEKRRDLLMPTLHLVHSLHNVLFCLNHIFSPLPPSPSLQTANSSQGVGTCLWTSEEMKKFLWTGEGSKWVPVLRMSGSGAESGGFAAEYILRALSVQQCRLVRESIFDEDSARHMNGIFRAVESTALDSESSWSGQQLDVNERNLPFAVWHLALLNLSQLRGNNRLLPAHISNIASFLHSALLLSSDERGGESEGEGLTARKVAVGFLHSESFQEMRELQEAVLGVCFEQTASCLPKSLKELKSSLLCCGGQLLDSSEHLARAVELGLQLLVGEDRIAKKRRRSVSISPQNISVCLEVMRAVPMAFSHPELLHRCVLVLTILHITLVESLCCREVVSGSMEERREQLHELQLVLAWVLHSLAHCDRVGKKKGQRLSPPPFSDLLSWFYSAMKHCTELIEDKAKERASLLLVEAVLENVLKIGSYPTSFIETVMEDVTVALTGGGDRCEEDATRLSVFGEKDSLPESILHLTVSKMCKVYVDLRPGQREGSFLHQPMAELLRQTRASLSQLRKNSPETVSLHPQLISSFSQLLRTNSPSDPLLSKCLKVARWLSEMICGEHSLQETVTDPAMLFPVLDVLSISATRTEADTEKSTLTLSLIDSWRKSLQILKSFLHKELKLSASSNSDYLIGMATDTLEGYTSGSRSETLSGLHLVLPQLSGMMNRLLSVASRDQTKSIFETLHKECCEDTATAVAVCYCWGVALSARLQSDSQRELRKWHTKILLQCGSLAVQHRGVAPVVILSINITMRLVALPAKVGLDSRLVLMSLHQTAIIRDIPEFKSKRFVKEVLYAVGQLLLTVLKHHSFVAVSCPGPIITTTNNLVRTALEWCAVKEEDEGEEMKRSTVVVNIVSRVLDHIASQQELSKYIPCVLGSCVIAMFQNLPAKPVKRSLLPGVYALMRQCSDEGTASVQASLDPNTRTNFQSLVEDFKKQKRFL